MHLLQEVTEVGQALVQKIVATVKEAYLTDICNRVTNSIKNTVAGVLTHLQDNYGYLMTKGLLERDEGYIECIICC